MKAKLVLISMILSSAGVLAAGDAVVEDRTANTMNTPTTSAASHSDLPVVLAQLNVASAEMRSTSMASSEAPAVDSTKENPSMPGLLLAALAAMVLVARRRSR